MSIFDNLIGLISPNACLGCATEGSSLCLACLTSEILPFGERCWRCNRLSIGAKVCASCTSFGGPNKVWISVEYSGLVKEIIKVYKFHHQRSLAGQMASIMADTFRAYNSDQTIQKRNYLIVPIPSATGRVRQRGFDHASLLSRELARELMIPRASVLLRLGQSRQVGATRADRLKLPVGRYVVRGPVAGRNILLVDDVITTGGTVKEVTKVLKAAGAKKVDALVFAKRL